MLGFNKSYQTRFKMKETPAMVLPEKKLETKKSKKRPSQSNQAARKLKKSKKIRISNVQY